MELSTVERVLFLHVGYVSRELSSAQCNLWNISNNTFRRILPQRETKSAWKSCVS